MSDLPVELKYAASHEWVRLEGDGTAVIGITDHAQAALGDVVYVELPEEGADIDAGAATKLKWKDSRQAMIDLGEAAKLEFQDITRAIELTDKIKTGGGMQMVLKVRQFLGVNSGDAGELASLFRTGVIARLKEMGTKPTDKDLEYLESAVQNLGQDQETNQRILRRMVGRVKQVISRGEYLKANKGMTQEDFNDNGYKARTYQWEGEEGERTPVSPPVSWDSL